MIPLIIGIALIAFSGGFALGLYAANNAPVMPDNYDTEDLFTISR